MGGCTGDADCIQDTEYGQGLECTEANSTFLTEHRLPAGTKVCLWKKWHGLEHRDKCQGELVWYGAHLSSDGNSGGGYSISFIDSFNTDKLAEASHIVSS